ncbi:MAG: hypothetical protein IAF38_05945 [Bacteroidia bacterium]|nr:hypothetical protein [Bacteroidia bacterium]
MVPPNKIKSDPEILIAEVIIPPVNSVVPEHKDLKKDSGNEISLICKTETELRTAMGALWEENIIWTRNFNLCLVDEIAGKEMALKRLHQNHANIGTIIKPYFGEKTAKKFTKLLSAHLSISVEMIEKAKAGNLEVFDESNKKWDKNSDDLSELLCLINPEWNSDEMKGTMKKYFRLTVHEAKQHIKKNHEADIDVYDRINSEIKKMVNSLSESIVQQFPDKFKTQLPINPGDLGI